VTSIGQVADALITPSITVINVLIFTHPHLHQALVQAASDASEKKNSQ